MVKAYWIVVALLAGGALGFFGGRSARNEPAVVPALKLHEKTGPVTPPSPEARVVHEDSTMTARRAGESNHPVAVTFTAEGAPPEATRCPGCIYVQGDDPNAPPVLLRDSGTVEHEAFMHEARDDSWAYLRESEIENSMLADISAGKFNKDRIECHSTICEVELSATGEQVETLKKWFDDKMSARRLEDNTGPLTLGGTSYQVEGNKASGKITYRKSQQFPAAPKRN